MEAVMASFEEALVAVKQGKRIRHSVGMNKWLVLEPTSGKLIHTSPEYGFLSWIPHQWEILDNDNWVIEQ
jgi:hypothetical protein